MSISKTQYYENAVFEVGGFAYAFKSLCAKLGANDSDLLLDISRTLSDGSTDSRAKVGIEELSTVCDFIGESIVELYAFFDGDGGSTFVLISEFYGALAIAISVDNPEVLRSAFQHVDESFGLKARAVPYGEKEEGELETEKAAFDFKRRLNELEEDLEQLRELVLGRRKSLRCFLSYRFDGLNELSVVQIQRFLNLLDVDVITGNSYEPRSISAKVSERLSKSIDFSVFIVGASGESMWVRDEIASLGSKGVPVVPLVENGAEFTPGIFGDLEIIRFEQEHIGDCFLKLLEAVVYVRTS